MNANMPSLVAQDTVRAERQAYSAEHAVGAFSSPSTRRAAAAQEAAVPAGTPVELLLYHRRRRPALPPILIPDGSCLRALAIPLAPSSPERATFPWPRDTSLINLLRVLSVSSRPVLPLNNCDRVALTLKQRAIQRLFPSTPSKLFWTSSFSLAKMILAAFLDFLDLRSHFVARDLGGNRS